MMLHPIIHIGYPKTGTTWFQHNLFPHVRNYTYVPRFEVLRKLIIYPSPFDFNSNEAKDFLNDFKSSHGQKELIISDEGFLGGNEYLFKDYAFRLKEVFHDATIIIFIRNQLSKIISSYSQYVKNNGGNLPIHRFLFRDQSFNRVNNISFFNISSLKYDIIIDFYIGLFGKSKVHIFLFEDFVNNPTGFTREFCLKFNLDVDLLTIDFCRRNEGLRKGLFGLVKFGNRFTRRNRFEKHYFVNIPYWYFIQNKLINYLNQFSIFGKTPGPENIFSKQDHEFLRNYYKVSNQNLIKNFDLSNIEMYGYPL